MIRRTTSTPRCTETAFQGNFILLSWPTTQRLTADFFSRRTLTLQQSSRGSSQPSWSPYTSEVRQAVCGSSLYKQRVSGCVKTKASITLLKQSCLQDTHTEKPAFKPGGTCPAEDLYWSYFLFCTGNKSLHCNHHSTTQHTSQRCEVGLSRKNTPHGNRVGVWLTW